MWLSGIMFVCSTVGAVGTIADIFMTPEQKNRVSGAVSDIWVWLANMKEASFEKRLKTPWIVTTAFVLPTSVQVYALSQIVYGEMTFRERFWDTFPSVFGIVATLAFGASMFAVFERLKRQSLWKRICAILSAIAVFLFLILKSYDYLTFDPTAGYEDQAFRDWHLAILFVMTVATLFSYFFLAGAPFVVAYALASLLRVAEYTFGKFVNFSKGSAFALCALVGVIGSMLRLFGY